MSAILKSWLGRQTTIFLDQVRYNYSTRIPHKAAVASGIVGALEFDPNNLEFRGYLEQNHLNVDHAVIRAGSTLFYGGIAAASVWCFTMMPVPCVCASAATVGYNKITETLDKK